MRLLLALATSLAVCCATATAGDWYTSIYGGVNLNNVISAPFVNEKTGLVVGGSVGRNNLAGVPGLRGELDLSFRTNEVEVFSFITANHDTTAAMFNLAYDFQTAGPVQPYLLLGAGYGHTEATFESVSLLKLERSDVAFQAGAGATVPIVPGIRFGVGYRFFAGPEIDVLGTQLSDGTNHSVIGSLKFDL